MKLHEQELCVVFKVWRGVSSEMRVFTDMKKAIATARRWKRSSNEDYDSVSVFRVNSQNGKGCEVSIG